ncbi:MAG: DUF4965 domain-containing protein [Clostridia bacterium]|nr:DUF4965 domain-containing protein [Clostridia bacterium]
MKLRAPAVPLITVDPYFSVWSDSDTLTENDTVHWTGQRKMTRGVIPGDGSDRRNMIRGVLNVDGIDYRFMGKGDADELAQTDVDITAMYTAYTFEGAGIKLTATFFTPLMLDDLTTMTRPVSYLKLAVTSTDGEAHVCKAKITASEELCLDTVGQFDITVDTLSRDGIDMVKVGSVDQPVLWRSGDSVRIDWGYFYMAAKGASFEKGSFTEVTDPKAGTERTVRTVTMETSVDGEALIEFAYDDIYSIDYFGSKLKSIWNKDGKTIEEAVVEAYAEYDTLLCKAVAFDEKLLVDATKAGGEKYSDLLRLAYRQVIAAHKLVVDTNGELLFISKECFSNGCAATVDVSYPSIPMFLIYNPELVLAMMRPVMKFAKSDAWKYDFAPHDAGRYPLVTGQVYGLNKETGELKFEMQMPVEECGNMLVMTTAYSVAADNYDFAKENLDLFEQWANYLIKYGVDPENQLCTDDFAGHLAHNCNLSLKAVMGLAGISVLCEKLGFADKAKSYMEEARKIAINWLLRASNGDGSYRLAFDKKGTFSMKYNIVWDKLFGTGLIPQDVWNGETRANRTHFNAYGMPLDSRKSYTKSDWIVWTATLCSTKEEFESYIAPLWTAYNVMPSRVPMTDWYDTVTSMKIGFQNRTVQGGLYIKLMEYYGTVKVGTKAEKVHLHSEGCSCHHCH